MQPVRFLGGLLLAVCLSVGVASAAVFVADESPTIATDPAGDAFIAGNAVSVTAPVTGELFAAGSTVSITKRVERSIYAGGNTVTIREGVGYNAFLAGNTITLAGPIGHDVYAAGSTIILEEGSEVAGDVRLAGETIILKGTIKGNIQISAEKFESSAIIGGKADIDASSVTFSGGSIAGDLLYESEKDATGLDKVAVTGKTERSEPVSEKNESSTKNIFFGILSMLLLGAIFVWLFPRKLDAAAAAVSNDWGKSFGWGLLFLIATPILSLILLMTGFGIPLAFLMMAGYAMVIIELMVFTTVIFGRWLLKMAKQNEPDWWMALLLGVVVTALLNLVPTLGEFTSFILFFAIGVPATGGYLCWLHEMVSGKQVEKTEKSQ